MYKRTLLIRCMALAVSAFALFAGSVLPSLPASAQTNNMRLKKQKKMKVVIWSDVVCPFCYIGKTKFETALKDFSDKNNVEIEWKSYQLMPGITTRTDRNIDQVLAETKSVSLKQARQMNAQAALMGKQAGLQYNFDKAIVANTFRAHQFLHFAKAHGKQNEAEGLMFRSYFTDGKNVDDLPTLIALGKTIGLDGGALQAALQNQSYANAVKAEINEAQQLGVNGVPFFVFNGKYAISGTQDSGVFLEALQKSFNEWKKQNAGNTRQVKEGAVCKPGGKCD